MFHQLQRPIGVMRKKIPRVDKLVIIAKWLNIELSDLLEKKKHNDVNFRVSELEKQIIISYRKADDIDKAIVLRSLGIEEKGKVAQKWRKTSFTQMRGVERNDFYEKIS